MRPTVYIDAEEGLHFSGWSGLAGDHCPPKFLEQVPPNSRWGAVGVEGVWTAEGYPQNLPLLFLSEYLLQDLYGVDAAVVGREVGSGRMSAAHKLRIVSICRQPSLWMVLATTQVGHLAVYPLYTGFQNNQARFFVGTLRQILHQVW